MRSVLFFKVLLKASVKAILNGNFLFDFIGRIEENLKEPFPNKWFLLVSAIVGLYAI